MDLMPGDIYQLRAAGKCKLETLVEVTCKSMLEALDYLARNDIIHRDVRPENILYDQQDTGGFTLKLANFGLRIDMSTATHNAQINPYKAPEVLSCRAQTHAADMWSLFATLCALADLYKPSALKDYREAWSALYSIATSEPQPGLLDLRCLREAVIWHVKYRATAAQMLVRLYNGVGLASPGNVPALMTWDTWVGLFGGNQVTQHLYDGHIDTLMHRVRGGIQYTIQSSEACINEPGSEEIVAGAPEVCDAAAQASMDGATEPEVREAIEQEMRGRIEAQMRAAIEPEVRQAMEAQLREAVEARDAAQARADGAAAACGAAEERVRAAEAARDEAERRCGEALDSERAEYMEARGARRASLTAAEEARADAETRLRDALEACDASRVQIEDAVRAREASEEQLMAAEVARQVTDEELTASMEQRDAVEAQLRDAIQARDRIKEDMQKAIEKRDTMAARVAEANDELDRVRLVAGTAGIGEQGFVCGWRDTTSSSADEEPGDSPPIRYQMNPVMEETHRQFNVTEPPAFAEREWAFASLEEDSHSEPLSFCSLSSAPAIAWERHFSDFSASAPNESRKDVFA